MEDNIKKIIMQDEEKKVEPISDESSDDNFLNNLDLEEELNNNLAGTFSIEEAKQHKTMPPASKPRNESFNLDYGIKLTGSHEEDGDVRDTFLSMPS